MICNWPQLVEMAQSAVTALPLTLGAYGVALFMYRRAGQSPLINPVLFGMAIVIIVLQVTETDYADYYNGAKILHFLLGTATVALAIPLYRQLKHVRSALIPIVVSSFVGALAACASAIAIAGIFGASELTLLSLAPKSTTAPVAMAIAEHMGGASALAAVIVILTGVFGAVFGLGLLRRFGFEKLQTQGIAMGVAAHGVGTARAMQVDFAMGAYAGLSMGIVAVMNSVLVPQIWALLRPLFFD